MKNKTLISLTVASILPLAASTAHATMASDAHLSISPGVYSCIAGMGTPPNSCTYGANITSGSFFGMDSDSSSTISAGEKTAINPYNSLILGVIQSSSGSHTGAPGCTPPGTAGSPCTDTTPSSESPSIDIWSFFGSTGMDYTTVAPLVSNDAGLSTNNTVNLGFSGWTVTWNGIPSIPMGSGSWTPVSGVGSGQTYSNGLANVTCAAGCSAGDTYTLDYTGTVPPGDPSGFGGVQYYLHLEGAISACTGDITAPTANGDTYSQVIKDTATSLSILANDTDTGCAGLNKGSVIITTPPVHGTATVDTTTGIVTYTPASGYIGADSFKYTVADRATNVSNTATVNITVINAGPTCNDDGIAQGAFVNTNLSSSVTINVLANDVVGSYPLDPTSVTIVNAPANGTAVANLDGTITYTPNSGFNGTDPITYTVSDTQSTPLTCAKATASVIVGNVTPIGPYLSINPGKVTEVNTKPAVGDGSWFSMETSPGTYTYTSIAGLNGIELDTIQAASTAGGTVITNIDQAWTFFGNLGVDQTTTAPTVLSNDGTSGTPTLDFSGWNVSWNQIASIPMGTGATVAGYTNGVSQMTCAATCTDGDTYTLGYSATVPAGDPSGFGGVHYFLHLEGTISSKPPLLGCLDSAAASNVATVSVIDDCTNRTPLTFEPGDTAVAVGNTTGTGLTAAQVGKLDPLYNPKDGQMCVGGCLDFKVKNLPSDHADIVVKLSAPVPDGGVYRKLINGVWTDFDTSGSDKIGSAPLDVTTGNCPEPTGSYSIGLRTGNQCLFLKIYDGGANDADGAANGTVVDPGGVLLAGSANVPASGSSGCSISSTPVKLSDRADWIVVMLFVAALGISRRRLKNNN